MSIRHNFIMKTERNRVLASKLEYHLKTLTKLKKETLIKQPKKLEEFLGEKIICEKYIGIF